MRLQRAILPILLLGIGIAAAVMLYRTRPAPAKKTVENPGELVEVATVEAKAHRLTVFAQGTLTAARSVLVQPEITGRVTWHHPGLVPGGRIKKGDALLRIDGRDYKLAAEQHEANVERAELQVRLERIQRELAKDEWQLIGEDSRATDEGRTLALRGPQLQAAEANLAAARSAQAQALLLVGRTGVTAPFNAWVQSEQVEVGQLVSPQSQVATLIGTDAYWVQVSIPADKLGALTLPGMGGADTGSDAVVKQSVGGQTVTREGKLLRLLGDLDPVGRLVRLLVEIEDPLNLKTEATTAAAAGKPSKAAKNEVDTATSDPTEETLPFLLGAYVNVEFTGKEVKDVIEVPRSALREDDKVYVYGEGDQLVIRDVEVVWRMPESVLVRAGSGGGLSSGERIVTSRISSPIAGMKLRTALPQGPPRASSN